jgi:hypothetical protein
MDFFDFGARHPLESPKSTGKFGMTVRLRALSITNGGIPVWSYPQRAAMTAIPEASLDRATFIAITLSEVLPRFG